MRKILAVVVFFLCVALAQAQTDRGTIRGSVTDPQGAVIVGATVTATKTDTGVSSVTVTNTSGLYNIPALTPGTYKVVITAKGFKTLVLDNVVTDVGMSTGLDGHLDIGSATETVVVTTETGDLKTEQSDVSTEVPTQAYMDLPLSAGGGRNAGNFRNLVNGVAGNGVNGGASYTGDFQVDGVTTQEAELFGDSRNIRFPPDSVQEMSLVAGNYAAEYGETGGGIERYVLKSGTKDFRGSVYEYFKNTIFDSKGYFNQKTPVDQQNEFGFTLGGPVWLPKVYDGRKRTFFFFNADFYRTQSGGSTTTISIPNAAMRNGDFSQLLSSGQIIYDPLTTRVGPSGKIIRDPFPGNIIPSYRISSVAQNILAYLPPSTTQAIVNNYTAQNTPTFNRFNTFTAKGDHSFNDANHLSLSYVFSHQVNKPYGSPLPDPIALLPLQFTGTFHLARVSYDRTIRPNLLNQFRGGYNRSSIALMATDSNGNYPQKLGLTGFQTGGGFFPAFFLGSYFSVGYYHDNSIPYANTYVISDALSWTVGHHNAKVGTELRDIRHANNRDLQSLLWFSRNETGDPQNLGPTGSEIASLLLGQVDATNIYNEKGVPVNPYWKYFDFYGQDDYKMTSRLVINYGLRLSIMTPYRERSDMYSIMDPRASNPYAGNLPGAYVFAGRDGQGSELSYAKGNSANLGPRLGAAFKLTEKTVLRGGYGITYFPTGVFAGGSTTMINDGFYTTSVVSSPDGYTPPYTFTQGFPQNKIQQPVLNASLNIANNFTSWDPIAHLVSKSQNWNLTMQREIVPSMTIEVAYVGTKGTDLSVLSNGNQLDPKYLALGDSVLRSSINSPAAIAAGIKAPWSGFTAALGANATVAQALRPFPQYLDSNAGDNSQNFGNSTYHALQVKLERKFRSGFYLLSNYAWSKYLTNANQGHTGFDPVGLRDKYHPEMDRGVATAFQPHKLTTAFTYELPIGPDKYFFNSKGPLGTYLLSGWKVSGILDYQSGANFGVAAPNNVPIFGGGVFADIVPGVGEKGTWSGKFNPTTDHYLNINAFKAPPADSFGNSKPYLPNLRGPAMLNEDLSVTKLTQIRDTTSFELRFEAFNAFNRTVFGLPNTDITNPTGFGQITSQANGARNAQVVAKIIF